MASAPVAQPQAVAWSVERVSATSVPQAGAPSAPVGTVQVQPSPSPAPSQEPAQVTVQQPPGISGYVPVEYLLPLVGLILIFFAASRPGGRAAMKAVLEVLFGPGGGGTPPSGP
ncbi:hypothetical protein AB0G87_37445 [Streptomyces asoensis]|uniref:hypothetical protein n=1 Tax=Streptomyces asoensis TaxID=249586 RepID=UPI0033C52ECF